MLVKNWPKGDRCTVVVAGGTASADTGLAILAIKSILFVLSSLLCYFFMSLQ